MVPLPVVVCAAQDDGDYHVELEAESRVKPHSGYRRRVHDPAIVEVAAEDGTVSRTATIATATTSTSSWSGSDPGSTG